MGLGPMFWKKIGIKLEYVNLKLRKLKRIKIDGPRAK